MSLEEDIEHNATDSQTSQPQPESQQQQSQHLMKQEERRNINMDIYSGKGLTGLGNLGNTCFLNSTIQCISHTYELNAILDKKHHIKASSKKEQSVNNIVYNEWNDLRKLMWNANCKISPGRFVSSIQQVAKHKKRALFTGFAQNDLPEFFLFFMDELHNALKRSVTIKVAGVVESNEDELAKKCYTMIEKMYKKEYSEIVDLFYGVHVSQIMDVEDDTQILAQTPEPFLMINLPIPLRRNLTIYDCFNVYTEKETLDNENMWYNEETKEKQKVTKQIRFFTLPDVLIIDFKRFTNTNQKHMCRIDFPLENLDLSQYMIGYDKESYVYDCYGICNHMGTALGGHYTAHVKNANGSWYHFNDANVSLIESTKSLVSANAYCLFYRKKNK